MFSLCSTTFYIVRSVAFCLCTYDEHTNNHEIQANERIFYLLFGLETNLMLDLCIALKRYVEACQVLLTFEGVTFRPVIPQLAFETRESLSTALQSGAYECTPPDNFAVDLLAKLLTVLVHLEAYCLTEVSFWFLYK